MNNRNNRICPVEIAGSLDIRIRRWVQNPKKILKHYIKKGMIILELGCGPGFFTIDIAQMVGNSRQVIAVDLQEGMLQKVRNKIKKTEFEDTIKKANDAGLTVVERPKIFLSKTAIFKKKLTIKAGDFL